MEGQWRRGPMIGCGSSAAVYLATMSGRSQSGGEVVFAVKSKELSKAGDLFTEQRILSGLESKSPHIVSYLGFEISAAEERTNELVYNLFLEYAAGGSLSDEIKRNGGRLSEAKIRARAFEILHGLAYLHEQGVVHCDIKSQNVLIGSNGRAKIADFGCAKNAFASKKEPVRGTPIFMAPEVARGEEQGMPADIWALGCTVIEMATGGSPWDSAFSDPLSAMHRIGFSDEVPAVPNWMSADAMDFLGKCLKRDWRERLSAKELLKHPFIVASSSVSKPSIIRENYWVSPTSNLDQGFWDTFSSLEEEDDQEQEQEEEQTESNVSERIKVLIGEFTGEPDWICDDNDDENWVTIRCNGIEEKIEAEEEFSFSSIVASDIHGLLFSVSEENLLEVSFVSERSILVGSSDNYEISLCENDEISVCNNGDFGFGFNFKHEIVDHCVLKQEIQIVKTLSGFVKVCCFLLINCSYYLFGNLQVVKLEIQAKQPV